MNALIRGLELVASGAENLSAPTPEDNDYYAFQAMTEALLEAKEAELLYEVKVQRSKKRATYGHAVRVSVPSGLTPKGREFLNSAKVPMLEAARISTSDLKKERESEIFQLKPTFMGMGIDLKALWKKWQARENNA